MFMNGMLKSILKNVRNQIVKIFNLFPLSDTILFESNPDFNDEGYWMCKKFLDEGMDKKYKICWYLKSHDSKAPVGWNISCIYVRPKTITQWIEKYYILHTTRCILDSCMFVPKRRKDQFRLFLHHGMPIKRIDRYMEAIGDCDYVSIGSFYFKNYYEQIKIPEKKLIAVGFSRNDQLKIKHNCINKLFSGFSGYKVIIWMPTYRQHETSDNGCNIPVDRDNKTGLPVIKTFEEAVFVNQRLIEKQELLIIKPHQSQNLQYMHIEELTNIKILTTRMLQETEVQLYSLLAEMDALITDYSSVYVDFLLTRRPIGLTIDDIAIYEKSVGFAVDDYKKDIQGFYIRNVNDFLEFLDRLSEDMHFMEDIIYKAYLRFHNVTDFSSADRLFQLVQNKASLRINKNEMDSRSAV